MKVLIELRPALEGHSGIPQEARLLFRGLGQIDGLETIGLIQSSNRYLAPGLPDAQESRQALPAHEQLNRLSRVVVSLQPPGKRSLASKVLALMPSLARSAGVLVRSVLGLRQNLTVFDPTHFRDFLWRGLFAKTLPSEDLEQVSTAAYRVARVPYAIMHACGLTTRKFGIARYPVLETRGIDVMLSLTPYPARLSPGTTLVVRYFDAVPLLMPHTIVNKAHHQALHYQALRCNVESGAWFACCSDATRRDLLSFFPEVAARAVTIHCMLSHHYFAEASSPVRVREILAKRRNPLVAPGHSDRNPFELSARSERAPDYLLMVSTIEPRKNHGTLLAAWEQLKSEKHPDLKLVIVGGLGWDHEAITARFRPWVERGEAFVLEDVPAEELRLLYKHARATVCPSFAEGFNYSGVEAMRCGGVVAASNIDVHREVYDGAAEYFSPYSVNEAAQSIDRVIAPASTEWREQRVAEGALVAERYLPERILPQWREFLSGLPR